MSFMFKVGNTYITQEGKPVTVISRTGSIGSECLECNDNIFRYDRSTSNSDAGRCTGTAHDYSDPRNFFRFDLSTRQ